MDQSSRIVRSPRPKSPTNNKHALLKTKIERSIQGISLKELDVVGDEAILPTTNYLR